MNSTKPKIEVEATRFWKWFSSVEAAIRETQSDELLRELDRRIFNIDSRLNWELGPAQPSGMQLVISPNFDRELVPVCRRIVALSPGLSEWFFFPFKPRRKWASTLTINDVGGTPVQIDATNWTYVILRYPEGHAEVLLFANQQLQIAADSTMRWIAAALALEILLGEELVLKLSLEWELLDFPEERFEVAARPLDELPSAFGLERM